MYDNRDPLVTVHFLMSINQNKDAKIVLDVMKKYCKTIPQIDSLGKLYSEIKDYESCVELAKMALQLTGKTDEQITIKTNIIRSLINLNRPLDALAYIEDIPENHANLMDKSMCYFLLNRKNEAEEILHRMLREQISEDNQNRIKFNLATYDLRKGKFKEGLKGFLVDGRKLDIWRSYDSLPISRLWSGEVQPGKTILVCTEGGFGDELISIRFMKHFRDLGMNPIWYTDRKDLAKIFERNGYQVIRSLDEYQYEWLWCYGMQTPCFLDLEENDLWYGPYLKPLRNKEKLPGKLKIGLKCSGNPEYDQDLHRTIPFKEVIDCLPKDATIYSFHIEEDLDDPRVISLRDKIKSWDDTLDYLDQMDIVVSSCTSLPHAAGAMGKKTVVVVPILTYYTWAYPSRHSKWYSENTTVLRQVEYDNWDAPLSELKDIFDEYKQD